MSKFIQTFEARFQATETSLQEAPIHNLENHISQLANLISRRQQSLPSNTKFNLREHVKVVTLKGGKEMRGGKFDSLAREEYNLYYG